MSYTFLDEAVGIPSDFVADILPPRPEEGIISAILSISFWAIKFCSSLLKNCDFDQILKMLATLWYKFSASDMLFFSQWAIFQWMCQLINECKIKVP